MHIVSRIARLDARVHAIARRNFSRYAVERTESSVLRENGIPGTPSNPVLPPSPLRSDCAHRWDINFYYGLFSFAPTRSAPRGGQQ